VCIVDPYVPAAGAKLGLEVIQKNGEFTDVDMVRVNHGNALSIFPRIVAKLNHHRPE
jgi:hypothetical protein